MLRSPSPASSLTLALTLPLTRTLTLTLTLAPERRRPLLGGDAGEMQGDAGEMQGRCREMQGRCRRAGAPLLGRRCSSATVLSSVSPGTADRLRARARVRVRVSARPSLGVGCGTLSTVAPIASIMALRSSGALSGMNTLARDVGEMWAIDVGEMWARYRGYWALSGLHTLASYPGHRLRPRYATALPASPAGEPQD